VTSEGTRVRETSRLLRWPEDAAIGLYRSGVLIVVCWIAPVCWLAIGIFLFQLAGSLVLGLWWILWAVWLFVIVTTRALSELVRLLVRRWLRIDIHPAYRATVPLTKLATGYWWNGYDYKRSKLQSRWNRWFRSRVRDPAAWRDLIWVVAAPASVGLVGAVPVAGIALGVYFLGFDPVAGTQVWGVLSIVAGLAAAPYAWRILGPLATRLLGPSSLTRLNNRVRQLVTARADATLAQAAEMRRIERDLHDGAQARLVALGMSIGAAEKVMDSDPVAAKQILREARQASSTALAELRDLVRGINPPVLTERGLVDAVRALALDVPLVVDVNSTLAGRLESPIEAALYFGVAELLANAAKHSGAARVTIDIGYQSAAATIAVGDDGRGGARATSGSGLGGLARRIENFDGTLSIDSPSGGPTRITMVVPCVLS